MAPGAVHGIINKGGFMRVYIFTLALCLFCLNAFADETWQLAPGIKEPGIKDVAIKGDFIYAASEKSLYRSEDNGKTWGVVFSAKGDSGIINFIGISKTRAFVCTDNGLFMSIDGRSGWKNIFKGIGGEDKSVLHIAFDTNKICLGTRDGLFTSINNAVT